MSKIIFIEPKAPNLHIFSSYTIPRIGNILLATMARQRGWDAEVIVEEIGGFDINNPPKADIVGISSITSTSPRAYRIANSYRRKGVPVIMGGPHVSFMPEEAIRQSDYVIRGEGEIPFSAFLSAFEQGHDFEGIPGLSFRRGTEIHHNENGGEATDLCDLPIPDLSLIRSFKRRMRQVIPVETSRGCPFNCTFCSVAKMFGRKMRYRPIEETVEELSRYPDRTKFFFVDDNFVASPKRAKELIRAVLDADLRIRWTAQVRCDAARDEELLSLMQQSGCKGVYVGIESINPQTLKRVRKGQDVEEVTEAIKRFHSHKMRVHGMFIFGFDEDDKESARSTWKYAKRTNLNTVQFLILTPLPGTRMYDSLKCEKRILTDDWSLFDAHHVVFSPKAMRPIELQRLQLKAHEKFYSLFQQVKHLFRLEFFEFLVAHYASRFTKQWKRINRIFIRWLKRLSGLKDKALARPPFM